MSISQSRRRKSRRCCDISKPYSVPPLQKFQGYRDVRMLKLRAVPVGAAPAGVNYRFAITYESEELRQKWVASDIHQEVWGANGKDAVVAELHSFVVRRSYVAVRL